MPGENWDYNCVQQMTLAELEIGGTRHKVLMQAAKNGFFYVIDRSNGKLLSANPFVPVNWASRYDLSTGRPVEIKDNLYTDTAGKLITPGPFGAHNWHPMSYSPVTGLVYFPAQESSFVYSRLPKYEHQPMRWNLAQNPAASLPAGVTEVIPNNARGYLLAWNPVTNTEAWRIEHRGPWNGGVLTTAGNLLIQGASDGRFVVYRADNGEKLWEMPIQTGAVAGPISYEVDGEQYIAVAAGWAGSIADHRRRIDPRSPRAVPATRIQARRQRLAAAARACAGPGTARLYRERGDDRARQVAFTASGAGSVTAVTWCRAV